MAETILRPKYEVRAVPQEEVPPRRVIMYDREKYTGMDGVERFRYVRTEKAVKDTEPHFMVYNLKGSSLRVRGLKELRRLGYVGTPSLIEEDTVTGETRELKIAELAINKQSIKATEKAMRNQGVE